VQGGDVPSSLHEGDDDRASTLLRDAVEALADYAPVSIPQLGRRRRT